LFPAIFKRFRFDEPVCHTFCFGEWISNLDEVGEINIPNLKSRKIMANVSMSPVCILL
jgi:hypothetical protein